MELESNNVKKARFDEEVAAYQKRYNKLVLVFKFFFLSLTLIIGATITYLIQSESSDQSVLHETPSISFQTSNPTTATESELFNLSLQNAAEELETAAALILSNYSNVAAFNSCREWLEDGSEQLREAIRVNPFPRRPGSGQRNEMANLIAAAERDVESCVGGLAAAGTSASAYEVAEKVYLAAAYLNGRGDFLMTYREKILRRFRQTVWAVIVENLIVICLFGFQMMFISFLFWKIFKSH